MFPNFSTSLNITVHSIRSVKWFLRYDQQHHLLWNFSLKRGTDKKFYFTLINPPARRA